MLNESQLCQGTYNWQEEYMEKEHRRGFHGAATKLSPFQDHPYPPKANILEKLS